MKLNLDIDKANLDLNASVSVLKDIVSKIAANPAENVRQEDLKVAIVMMTTALMALHQLANQNLQVGKN
ncbi:MAG: hypothetical protein DMG76_23645 [Acidobacteria bacterium]|nr:MAG: hypothetical protein DMG76_23645 [Acidobacteriota bacterium]